MKLRKKLTVSEDATEEAVAANSAAANEESN
jgi:hypothetical protein